MSGLSDLTAALLSQAAYPDYASPYGWTSVRTLSPDIDMSNFA